MSDEVKTILSFALMYLEIFAFILAGLRDENYKPEPPKPKTEVPFNSYGKSILLSLNKRTGESNETE